MDAAGMLAEGAKLAGVAPNVVVKVPLTREGLIGHQRVRRPGHPDQRHLCASPPPRRCWPPRPARPTSAPFIGRLDDHGADGMDLISEIRAIYDNYDFDTEILAASIRNPGPRARPRPSPAPTARPFRPTVFPASSSTR